MRETLYRELDQGFVSCLAREQFPPMEGNVVTKQIVIERIPTQADAISSFDRPRS